MLHDRAETSPDWPAAPGTSVVAARRSYRCPGERLSIEPAVHFGRLASGYPPCRNCRHRHDHGELSQRRRRLVAALDRRSLSPTVAGEGFCGVLHNDVEPATIRRLGAAMGMSLHETPPSGRWRGPQGIVVVLTSDDRPQTAELVASAAEGLRWAGCDVIDGGVATSAGTALAVLQEGAHGGFLLGNPAGNPSTVGVKLYGRQGNPLSEGDGLGSVATRFKVQHLDRPSRRFGGYGRMAIEARHFALLRPWYHGLRPLRFVVGSPSRPVLALVRRLCETSGCRCVVAAEGRGLEARIRAAKAHFGVWIGDDGEVGRFFDEGGEAIAAARLAGLLAETTCTAPADVELAGSHSRAAAWRRACRSEEVVSLEPGGRIWCRPPALPCPAHAGSTEPTPDNWPDRLVTADALVGLTLLLTALSRSDRPLSAALDAVDGKSRPATGK